MDDELIERGAAGYTDVHRYPTATSGPGDGDPVVAEAGVYVEDFVF
jgi:hypothetical protein